MIFYPLKLKPITKNAIWGGNKISEILEIKNCDTAISEAWMLSCRDDGMNVIQNGEYAGMELKEYINKAGQENIFGNGNFPLLIKIIDAADKLSVQVHPDDEYAKAHGNDAGKTEMWYILDAEPGAMLTSGIKQGVTADEFCAATKSGKCEEHLKYVPVKKGDCFYVPAGLVHAIGGGILIVEIQQNSNTTYRLYDYERRDNDGNLRELDVKSAKEVIKTEFDLSNVIINEELLSTEEIKTATLCSCKYFSVSKTEICRGNSGMFFTDGNMMHLLCISGSGLIKCNSTEYEVKKGDSYLIPRAIKDFTIDAIENIELIVSL